METQRIKQNIKKTLKNLVIPVVIAGMIGIPLYLSRVDYREFVPTSTHYSKPVGKEVETGYHIYIKDEEISITSNPAGLISIVDKDCDLIPDHTETGMVTGVRCAGKVKRDCNADEKEIFYKVIQNSEKFGEGI